MKYKQPNSLIAHIVQTGDCYAGYVFDPADQLPPAKMADEQDEFTAYRMVHQMIPQVNLVSTDKFLHIVDNAFKNMFLTC